MAENDLSDNAELLVIAGFKEEIAREVDKFKDQMKSDDYGEFDGFVNQRVSLVSKELEAELDNKYYEILGILGFDEKTRIKLTNFGLSDKYYISLRDWLNGYIYSVKTRVDCFYIIIKMEGKEDVHELRDKLITGWELLELLRIDPDKAVISDEKGNEIDLEDFIYDGNDERVVNIKMK